MKILVVSTVYNSTPPVGYGGIQRVVHYLTEALARLGHEVILMAPPRSWCSGRTIHVQAYDPDRTWSAVRGEGDLLSEEPLYTSMAEFLDREDVDVIHDWSFQNLYVQRHPDRFPFVVSTCIPPGPGYSRTNLVASSDAHARLIGGQTRFVHYGLPLHDWPYRVEKRAPPIHIAKLAWFKGQHLAQLASMRARRDIVFAGNVENPRYWNLVFRPLLALNGRASYLGELKGTQSSLLDAAALVQTPRWFDCFPLVVLEALACATPVISLSAGGIPEQVTHGRTGFLCGGIGELAQALHRIDEIDPIECRRDAERRFSDVRMAEAYLALYREAASGARW